MSTPTTDTAEIETPARARMREIAVRYAQCAEDMEHPAPHWNMERERKILADLRRQLGECADGLVREARGLPGTLGLGERDDANLDALCDTAIDYFEERRKYVGGFARDYTECATAWRYLESAAATF